MKLYDLRLLYGTPDGSVKCYVTDDYSGAALMVKGEWVATGPLIWVTGEYVKETYRIPVEVNDVG